MINKNNDALLERFQEHHKDNVKALAEIGSTIMEIRDYLKKQNTIDTQVIFIPTGFDNTFTADGYQFNSLFVSDAAVTDAAKVVITLDATTYTVTLAAGENVINIPNMARYHVTTTSNNGITAVLWRYNTLRK